ncbi:MAG TPA: KGK domain-containing protein [Coleofasciculaceae cyanobacterium]|jgi:hypothetical protein
MAKPHQYEITYDLQVNANEHLNQCDSKDVISLDSDKWISVKKIKDVIEQSFNQSNGLTSIINYISSISGLGNTKLWFHEGEECEILRAGSKGWQKGKIKINVTLEFIPDEAEEKSPLDDVRQELDRDNY